MRLAFVDWGIGGLDLFSRVRRRAPALPLVYVSDSGSAPYGQLSAEALRARLHHLERVCRLAGTTHLVVACNTLSSVLDGAGLVLPTVGVVRPARLRVAARAVVHLGVVGTERTVASGVYSSGLEHVSVTQVATPTLGPLIESGEARDGEAHHIIEGAMRRLRHVDTLVIGCTHYAAYRAEFERHAPGAEVIDPAEATERWLARAWLARTPPSRRGRAEVSLLTTGCPERMRRAAQRAFGLSLGHIQRIAGGAPSRLGSRA